MVGKSNQMGFLCRLFCKTLFPFFYELPSTSQAQGEQTQVCMPR